MKGVSIHRIIPVSDTNLTPGLRIGFVSSQLTVDKLLTGNPRAITSPPKMSCLHEEKRYAFVDHPTRVYTCCANG